MVRSADPEGSALLFREGDQLVFHRDQALPMRCLGCGRKVKTTVPTRLSWVPPAVWVAFVALGAGLIVYLIFRKVAYVDVPLCSDHRRAARRRRQNAMTALAFGLFGLFAATALGGVWLVLPAVALCAAGTIAAVAWWRPLQRPTKIHASWISLANVSPKLLSALPPAPLRLPDPPGQLTHEEDRAPPA